MTLFIQDDIIKDPKLYLSDIFEGEFIDINDGDKVFKNIQPRNNDEFEKITLFCFPDYDINYNFIRKSPLNQIEPNFIHDDSIMGDITVILYLNEVEPEDNGTTIYDSFEKPICKIYSKFNRMIAFESRLPHSRNIFENFGTDKDARLIQVIFLKRKYE